MKLNFDDMLSRLGMDMEKMNELLTPNFKFALREDLKDLKGFLPTRATPKSTGWDVSCAWEDHQDQTVQPGEFIKVPLGICCIPAEGYWFEVRPRSSSFVKKHMHALYGVVDWDFRNQIFFCAQYAGTVPLTLKFGEKIGQIIPVKLQEMAVEEISYTEFHDIWTAEMEEKKNERQGGFGSTDGK